MLLEKISKVSKVTLNLKILKLRTQRVRSFFICVLCYYIYMNKTIGIVGGGQLGRMLADAGHKLGFKIVVLDPTENCPASIVADKHILGSFKDKEKILELASVSDFITFEIESANAEALRELEKEGVSVYPSSKTLSIIKDKFMQKVFLSEHDIPVAHFAIIENKDDIKKQADIFGYPFLLKTRFDAYDGRGNFVIKNEDDIEKAWEKWEDVPLYAEKFVPFEKELACVSARDMFGTIVSYPPVETVHKNNICHIVRSPAPVDKNVLEGAEILASKVLNTLAGIGVFAVEMFLSKDGDILVNEIAPRVHNSGHHTIEGFTISQFEQQIRAISGMPLSTPEFTNNASVMINILGERNGEALCVGKEDAESINGVNVHIYGKIFTRPERKMGHITVVSDSLEDAENKALEARKKISI